jgi:hypothetical protein
MFSVYLPGSWRPVHGKIAWRVKVSGKLAIAQDFTREAYQVMAEYLREMKAVLYARKAVRPAAQESARASGESP